MEKKANKLQVIGVIIKSMFVMVRSCALTAIRHITHTINRDWVNHELNYWANSLLRAAKVDYHIYNPHEVSLNGQQPYLLMCNHNSHYDIPLSVVALEGGSIRMLAKRELAKVPLMGQAMRKAEFAFVDRENSRQAIKDLRKVRELMQIGITIWVAPEGTRSLTGKLGPLKSGGFVTAIKAKAFIIPIGIRGSRNILPAKTWHFSLRQRVEIHIGKPIDASQYTLKQKEELMEKVRSRLLALSGESQNPA